MPSNGLIADLGLPLAFGLACEVSVESPCAAGFTSPNAKSSIVAKASFALLEPNRTRGKDIVIKPLGNVPDDLLRLHAVSRLI
jgi:hypothetical protein